MEHGESSQQLENEHHKASPWKLSLTLAEVISNASESPALLEKEGDPEGVTL